MKRSKIRTRIVKSMAIVMAVMLLIMRFGSFNVTEAETNNIIYGDLKPQEVYSDKGIVITITGVSQDDYDYRLLFTAENNSNKNYCIQLRNENINGWMVDSTCSSDVNAGKKIRDRISFWKPDLIENGITEIEYIEFNFHIFDNDNWFSCFDSPTIRLNFDKHEHDFSTGEITINPTCTRDGEMTYTCPSDGVTMTEVVPALGHDYEEQVTDPTCTENGFTTYTCSRCGDQYVSDYTDMLPHNPQTVPAVEPTCTEAGLTEGSKCSICGEIIVEQEEIPAFGHQWELSKWTWMDDNSKASAEFICKSDPSHTQTVEAVVTSKQTKESTYTEKGEMVYTATATFEGKDYSDTRTVEIPVKEQTEIKLTGIKIDPTAVTMATSTAQKMSSQKLNVTFTPANAANKGLTWTSSDPSVARVDQNGNLTALKYGKVTITATSKENSNIKATCTVQTRFYDVNGNNKSGTAGYQYYFDPVYWAATTGITKGYALNVQDGTKVTDSVFFGPARNCTRKEMIIFMWRASGKPSANGSLPFSDTRVLSKNTDSYKAILWGYTKGIIKGYTSGKFKGQFRPDDPVVRKDCLIMLYRLAGKPSVSGKIQFLDVVKMNYKPSSDTYKAILWGVKKGITNGYSDGNFQPMTNCLREHIVTFLYRFNGKPGCPTAH